MMSIIRVDEDARRARVLDEALLKFCKYITLSPKHVIITEARAAGVESLIATAAAAAATRYDEHYTS
jgi:hypothetical protein